MLSTKAFTGMVAILFLLAASETDKYNVHSNLLITAAQSLQLVFDKEFIKKHIQSLAKKLSNKRDIFVLGRDVSYPLALEAALKIKEVTYLHAEGLAGGELKHGTIALIEEGTPCIIFAPLDDSYDSIISNTMEIKARGALTIGISPTYNTVFDFYIPVADSKILTLFSNIAIIQLLAYYIAVELGNDPDKPRNLAKSVTVK
ncbi:MAG: SIS domain-containing protein [Patescibacteria group bacterium]